MATLIAGLILFLAPHSVSIVGVRWRDAAAARIGEGAWKGLYCAVSAAGFVLIVWGDGTARAAPVPVYVPASAARHVTMLAMLFVFPLLVAAYLPGRIRRTARHPMLIAVILWALAHLLANGMLADVVLFGAFLVWSVADLLSLTFRTPRAGPALPSAARNDVLAVGIGVLLYLAFVAGLHAWLVGVALW